VERLSSGVDVIDELIEGVRVGDNLVVQVSGDVPTRYFVDRFVAAAGERRVVVADLLSTHGRSRSAVGEMLDWSSLTSQEARANLREADRKVGGDAAFVFDSLTAVQDRWGSEAALELFLWACPRLYRRRSVALWLVDRNRHDAAFLARLAKITQVVITVRRTNDRMDMEVEKADGRPRSVVGRSVQARFVDGELAESGPVVGERERLGNLVRTLRTTRGLSQADLARRIGVTPSALSQVERGVRGLAAESLMRVWEALGVPFGPDDPLLRGYRIARRSGHEVRSLAAGVSGQQLADDPVAGSAWRVTIEAGAAGRQPMFAVKGLEIVWVLSGVLDVEISGHAETVHEGDTLVITDAMPGGWANPADGPTELIWFLPR